MNMNQLEMFNTNQFVSTHHPGDLTGGEWLDQPSVKFHASEVAPNLKPHLQPETHYGTRGLADQVASSHIVLQGGSRHAPYNLSKGSQGEIRMQRSEDAEQSFSGLPRSRSPQVYARRVPDVHDQVLGDQHANEAHAFSAYDRGAASVSSSVAQSAQSLYTPDDVIQVARPIGRVLDAAKALRSGQAVGYLNTLEKDPADDRSPTEILKSGEANSWVVPDPATTTTSWEDDVQASPNTSHMAKQFAADRLARGRETTAPIRPTSTRFSNDIQQILPGTRRNHEWGQQLEYPSPNLDPK